MSRDPTLDALKIVVIGAGIGGLAAALALALRGARVAVLEQAPAIAEVGAGLQLSPNGMAVIHALGLADALSDAPQARAVSLRDFRAGTEVLRLDLAARGRDHRFVHRADLIDVLARAARKAGVDLRTGQAVAAVTPGEAPHAALVDGGTVAADLVIGADGLHSVVRQAMGAVPPPAFTGQTAWRAVVPNVTGHPPEACVHMGPGSHVVSYPLRDGAVVNLVAVEERRDWTDESWSRTGSGDALRAAFGAYGGGTARLLAEVETPGFWGLFRHPVAARWHAPGIAILGDAAHPTLPFLAQGANLALEDAWVLADALALPGGLEERLHAYQTRRRERAARVVAAADGNAWKFHLRNPLLRGAARAALRLGGRMAPDRILGRLDWLYDHDVTRD